MQIENEKLIEQFLFGEMSEDERFAFEEKFITDADLFEQVKILEDELIEKYIRGWINPAERAKFEQNFLTTNKRRERVEFSRWMIQITDEKREKAFVVKKNDTVIAEESVRQKIAALFLSPKTAMAAAFAILIAVFGTWFVYQNFNNKTDEFVKNENSIIVETPKEIFSPTPEINPFKTLQNSENENSESIDNAQTDSSKQTEDSVNETNKISVKKPTPKKPAKETDKSPIPVRNPPIQKPAPNPVLTLFAGTLRSGGKNNILTLPENVGGAILQLNLKSVDYKIYQAELTDADGNVIFQKGSIKINKSKINLFIPAAKLAKGDYLLKLYGINASGENESTADFQFRVNR